MPKPGSTWHTSVLCMALSIGCGGTFVDQPDAAVGDGEATQIPDAGPEAACPFAWTYESPGCGADARPVCMPVYDAATYCNTAYCTCGGQTLRGLCESPQVPWRDARACDDADAVDGADVADASCPGGYARLYAAPGCGVDAHPVCAYGFGYGNYTVGCSCDGRSIEIWPAIMYAVGQFASEPFASLTPCDDPGDAGLADAGARTCAPPFVWQYDTVGCGIGAHPLCAPPWGTACYRPACSCSGHTLGMCQFANEPIALLGVTCEEAGAGDAGPD